MHPSSGKGDSPKLGSLRLRVFGLFFFHYPQALDHLEGEAHYAALLALVLDVDGLVVVVDEYLGEDPFVVVEPLGPLRDGLVLYIACLLGHRQRFLLPSITVVLPQRGSVYSTEEVSLVLIHSSSACKWIPRTSQRRSSQRSSC